jgi:hypothetical protein
MPSGPEVPREPLLFKDRASKNLQTMSLLRSVGEDTPIQSPDVVNPNGPVKRSMYLGHHGVDNCICVLVAERKNSIQ